ncbi:hypothetical protein MRY87_00455 [bacterium]|nr:hypothetical protein [bacterium]
MEKYCFSYEREESSRDEDSSAGFSLAELLFALSLTLGVSLFAVPAFQDLQATMRLRLLEREVRFLLREGERTAQLLHQPVDFFAEEEYFRLRIQDTTTDLQRVSIPEEVTVTFPQTKLTFFPQQVSSPGTLLLSLGSTQCAIVLSLRGRIRRSCS